VRQVSFTLLISKKEWVNGKKVALVREELAIVILGRDLLEEAVVQRYHHLDNGWTPLSLILFLKLTECGCTLKTIQKDNLQKAFITKAMQKTTALKTNQVLLGTEILRSRFLEIA
jgi:hypothetical protein